MTITLVDEGPIIGAFATSALIVNALANVRSSFRAKPSKCTQQVH